MPIPLDAPEVLNREFLQLRARLLELAAALDRIDRAAREPPETGIAASMQDDSRMACVRQALVVLAGAGPGRAEQVQQIFSDPYLADWRERFGLPEKK